MQVAEIISSVVGADVPVRVIGYDGSKAGPDSSELALRINSPRALATLATAPGTLGLARAYVSGEIEVEGDLYELLAAMAELTFGRPRPRRAAPARPAHAADLAAPPPAAARRRSTGPRAGGCTPSCATRGRSRHHYDVSNRFYEWVLGPSMTYTCACYPSASATLEEAQAAKYELVAQKLALEPGMRLLDVGCGWGGMVMHAAAEHGVKALGVTLSRNQAEWAQAEIERRGLGGLAEVRHCDYRDVAGVAVRRDQLDRPHRAHRPGQPARLLRVAAHPLRPEGRLLNHCITQPRTPVEAARPVHRPLRVPGRRAGGGRADHLRDERRRASRCATRRTCASTTR